MLLQRVAVDNNFGRALLDRSDSLDDLFGADDLGEVGRSDLVERDGPSLLQLSRVGSQGTVDGVELLEGRLGPDNKTTEMSSRSELKKTESLNIQNIDSGDVTESSGAISILTVDNNWSELLLVLVVAHLSLSGASALGSVHPFDISPDMRAAEEGNSLLGLAERLDLVRNDEWDFSDLVDDVTASLEKSGNTGSGDGGANGKTLLGEVDTTVPAAPDFEGSEHVTTTAHISESSLARTVGTTTTDTGDTSNSSSSSP